MTSAPSQTRPPNPSKESKSMRTIFIANLHFKATDAELLQILSQAGPVVNVAVQKDKVTGLSKGYGFCEYASVDAANSALQTLNGITIQGRALQIKPRTIATSAPSSSSSMSSTTAQESTNNANRKRQALCSQTEFNSFVPTDGMPLTDEWQALMEDEEKVRQYALALNTLTFQEKVELVYMIPNVLQFMERVTHKYKDQHEREYHKRLKELNGDRPHAPKLSAYSQRHLPPVLS